METALKELETVATASIAALELYSYEASSINTECTMSLITRFDLKGWRSRLGKIVRQLENTGNLLCDWSRLNTDPSPEAVNNLSTGIESLVKHVKKFPAARGRYYLKAACEASIAVVTALGRIVNLLPRSRIVLIEPYQWNQTRRIRDLSQNPIEHLMSSWEQWLGLLRETIDETGKLSNGLDDNEDSQLELYDEDANWEREMLKSITPSEKSMVKDCVVLMKLCRSLMKRVKMKCIAMCPYNTPTGVMLIDTFYEIGFRLEVEIDQFASSLFPAHDNLAIREIAIVLAKTSQELTDLARVTCAEASASWFESCRAQIDRILSPILERAPIR